MAGIFVNAIPVFIWKISWFYYGLARWTGKCPIKIYMSCLGSVWRSKSQEIRLAFRTVDGWRIYDKPFTFGKAWRCANKWYIRD